MKTKIKAFLLAVLAFAVAAILVAPSANAAQHRITGYYSIGPIRAYDSNKCLELVSDHYNQKIDWAPCSPVGTNSLEMWHTHVIHGSTIVYLAGNPSICIDGGPHAGEYLYSTACDDLKPTSGIYLWGKTQDGAQNGLQSILTSRWITFHGGIGPVSWDTGRSVLLMFFFGPPKTQRVYFVGGWVEVTT